MRYNFKHLFYSFVILLWDGNESRALKEEMARKNDQPSPYRQDHAQATNKGVNEFAKSCQSIGKVCSVVTVGIEACSIVAAREGERFKAITRSGGRLGGGFLGGAAAGAALGALDANPLTVLAGMAIGGIAGAIVGAKAIDAIWDWFS